VVAVDVDVELEPSLRALTTETPDAVEAHRRL